MGLKPSKVFAARDDEQEEIKASGDAGYGATEETDKSLNDDNVAAVNDNDTAVKDNDGEKLDQEVNTQTGDEQSGTDTSKGDYGDPHYYDPDFKGPIKQRSCTDIICLLLFVAFVIGWIFIGSLAYRFGDPEALMVPTDSLGRKCGRDPAVKQFPYLHFFDITKCANPIVLVAGCPTQQVCVQQCPKSNFFASPFALKEDLCTLEVRREFFCAPEVNATAEDESGSFQRSCQDLLLQDCAPYTIKSAPILGRCMPNIGRNQTSTNGTLVDDNNELIDIISLDKLTAALKNMGVFISIQGFGESVWTDLQASWWVIVTALIVCMVVSFLWIVLMRWFTGVLVWVSLFGSLAAIIYGCVYTYMRYDWLRKMGSQETVTLDVLTNNLGSMLEMKDTWLAFFILLAILGCVMLLLILILFKRLRIAIEVIEEASKAVTSTLFSLFYPIYPWIVQLSTVIVFVAVALHIASMSTKEYRVSNMPQNCTEICPQFSMNDICDPQRFNESCQSECPAAMCTFYSYRKYKTVPYLHLYNLFALLWLMFFASAMGQMVLAGAFASWYFTFDKSKNLPMFPLLDSTHRTFRYHIGTLAFGSLLVAIIRLIRLILDYIQKKCAKYPGSQVVQCVLCACKCCMWCLETFLRFINRNAYIMCAIYGKNFCTSAKDAFSLLMRNALRVLAVNSVCDFLLFLGKVLITASVTVGSFYFLDSGIEGTEDVVPETQNSWVLILTIGLGCYFITSLFFSVYAMAVDTIFLCFLEDIERNDGSIEKPYFMSKDLMKLIGKRNKARMPTHSSTSLDKQ